MKFIVKNYFTKQRQRIISALALTSILSLSTGLTLLQAAAAASINLSQEAEKGEMVTGKGKLISQASSDRANQLPSSIAKTVRRDLSRRVGIPAEKLRITKYSRKTWPNGCLGLARPDEVCTQALVEGWRITLSDGRQTWVYRTDSEGLVLRLEPQKASVNLPKSVADAVLQAASQQSGLPISELRIIQAEQRTWSDGCLGLGTLVELCLQALVPGWLVTVEGGQQRLVYHTNASGSVLRLNEAASQIGDAGTIKPVSIPKNELPPPLKEGAIFRAITSGGITGRTYETNLFKDGRVIRVAVNPNGTTSQPQTDRISQQQVQKFQQVLQQQQFARFNGLSYPPPSGAADYITVTFTSRAGTIRYNDINQDRLPRYLQAIIQAWDQLLSNA
jgi:hypothetical protein